jgi:hypothetical protein
MKIVFIIVSLIVVYSIVRKTMQKQRLAKLRNQEIGEFTKWMTTRYPGFLESCMDHPHDELKITITKIYMDLFRSEKELAMMAGHSYDEWYESL